jgi:hypothetical protein
MHKTKFNPTSSAASAGLALMAESNCGDIVATANIYRETATLLIIGECGLYCISFLESWQLCLQVGKYHLQHS